MAAVTIGVAPLQVVNICSSAARAFSSTMENGTPSATPWPASGTSTRTASSITQLRSMWGAGSITDFISNDSPGAFRATMYTVITPALTRTTTGLPLELSGAFDQYL